MRKRQRHTKIAALCLLLLGLGAAAVWVNIPHGPISARGRYGPQWFWYPDGTRQLGESEAPQGRDGSVSGSSQAGVYGGGLRLSQDGTGSRIAAFKIPDLNPGQVIRKFEAHFDLLTYSRHQIPNGAVSMTFGPRRPGPGRGPRGFTGTGLSIRFDTHHRGSDPSSIDLIVDDRMLASTVFDFKPRRRNHNRFLIRWSDAGLDLEVDGTPVFVGLRPKFQPRMGDEFAFSAHSGTTGVECVLDNLSIHTWERPTSAGGGLVLSEIMPRPHLGLRDDDLELSDWIEVHNASNQPLDLRDHRLRLGAADSGQSWTFPPYPLAPFGYALVFASGKDRHRPRAIHTNFRLDDDGGELSLLDPQGVVLSRFRYGKSSPGAAFGWVNTPDKPGFLAKASPGQPNRGKPKRHAEAAAVHISHPGGMLTGPLVVRLSAPEVRDGAVIRFTIDGKKPGPRSTLYEAPLTIRKTSTLRAAVFAKGHLRGPISQSAFVFLSAAVAAFHSNLPVLIADSGGVRIDADFSPFSKRKYRPVYSALFTPGRSDVRSRTTATPSFAGFGAMRVRGHSSALKYPKKQYAWELRDDRGEDQAAALLGMPADSDWVLNAPYSDKSLMRNVLAYGAGQVLFGPGGCPRTRFLELFFNQDGGEVTMDDYLGVYVLTEKIKRGKGRIDIAELNETITDQQQITGGYVIKFDKGLDWDTRILTRHRHLRLGVVEPDRLNPEQARYLSDYLTKLERSLTPELRHHSSKGYRRFIDPDSFLHLNWMVEIFHEIDGWWISSYFTKDRGGKLRAMPLWDFNLAMGNIDQNADLRPKGWYRDIHPQRGHPWFNGLLDDPAMQERYWQLYNTLRRREFSNQSITASILRLAQYLEEAAERNFKRWPILGKSVWPNSHGSYQRRSFRDEVEFLRTWLIHRLEWIDSQNTLNPQLTETDGQLRVSLPPGSDAQLYYTTDGSDPGANRDAEQHVVLDGATAPGMVLIPSQTNGGAALSATDWTNPPPPPNAAQWTRTQTSAPGYELIEDRYHHLITHRVDAMYGNSPSCYIRIPFVIDELQRMRDAAEILLRIRCDDGFVAYLNGQKIAESNAPSELSWQSAATKAENEARAIEFLDYDLDRYRSALRLGDNVLAIHGLNHSTKSSDALWHATLTIIDAASRQPPPAAQHYSSAIDLRDHAVIKVAAFDGRCWGRTLTWSRPQ